jgi:uroporphyrinogen decarboxylase
LPAVRLRYGAAFDELLKRYERDIISIDGPLDMSFVPGTYQEGMFTDSWNTTWTNLQAGMVGQVKNPVFADTEKIKNYKPPVDLFAEQWKKYTATLSARISEARAKGKFVTGGWVNLFERMQFLRGTEDLYCDIAERNDDFSAVLEIVFSFYKEYVTAWADTDVDAVVFGDDWGSQRSLLISPKTWRDIFKPAYRELIDIVKGKGKYVFFHSDGYIMDIYPEFIDLGVDAINSQIWCMGVENVAEKYAGKITFWGEISRQDTIPSGSRDDIFAAARKMKQLFFKDGGLIGQSEVGRDVSLENIKAVLTCWN